MAVTLEDIEKAVVEAVVAVLKGKGVAAAEEASRGAIFLARAEKTMQDNDHTMSASTKAALAHQHKLAFEAYILGYAGVTALIAAQAFQAAVNALLAILPKVFLG